jgi:hypothetical protein
LNSVLTQRPTCLGCRQDNPKQRLHRLPRATCEGKVMVDFTVQAIEKEDQSVVGCGEISVPEKL